MDDGWIMHPAGRLYYRRWQPAHVSAASPPIVLLHDSLGCVALWRDFPAALAQATGHVVIAYDRLGFGRSDPHPDRLDFGFVRQEAEDGFAALRAQLRIGRFIVFGHSVGGGMAVHCAARWPEDCVALITESAQAMIEERTRTGIRAARDDFQQPEHMARLVRYHGSKADWVLASWVDTWLSPAFADWSLADVLPRVRCPVLALHGAEDEFGSTRHPEIIVAGVSGPACSRIFEGVRHVPHREVPQAVLMTVQDFFRALPTELDTILL